MFTHRSAAASLLLLLWLLSTAIIYPEAGRQILIAIAWGVFYLYLAFIALIGLALLFTATWSVFEQRTQARLRAEIRS